jgi:hypothetical protein
MLFTFLLVASGLVLDTLTRRRRELKQSAQLTQWRWMIRARIDNDE